MAGLAFGSEQVPPLSARVTVTVVVTVEAFETEQLVKPFVSSTVGLAGTVKTEVTLGKAIVIVSPVRSAPVALGVKPTVQVARAVAASVVAANVTVFAGVVAAAIVGAAPTLVKVLSTLVLTCQLAAAGEPATPLLMPGT